MLCFTLSSMRVIERKFGVLILGLFHTRTLLLELSLFEIYCTIKLYRAFNTGSHCVCPKPIAVFVQAQPPIITQMGIFSVDARFTA